MTWHRVLLLAENLWVEKPEGPARMGLYVTRFVRAEDADAAVRLAVEALWQELQGPSSPMGCEEAVVRAEEIAQVTAAEVPEVPQGYALFHMDPQPPFLLLNPARPAAWAERRRVQDWAATRSFVADGNYRGAEAHDAAGLCWPVLEAGFAEKPSGLDWLLPWRQHRLTIRLGLARQVPFATVRSTLQRLWQGAEQDDDRAPLPTAGIEAAEGIGDLVDLLLGQSQG